MKDFTHVWARPGEANVIDFAKPDGTTMHFGRSSEEVRKLNPTAELLLFEDWRAAMEARENPPISWLPSTEEDFWDALEALPPAARGGGGFLLGEPVDHHGKGGRPRFHGHREMPGAVFLRSSRPMTVIEFRAEVAAKTT